MISGCLLGLYYFPYSDAGPVKKWLDAYLHGYASSAATVLRWFEPEVSVVGQTIAGRASLRIVRTCDAMDVTIFVQNGPCTAGLGEAYLSFSIATPTGEGVTTPLTFTRVRRSCTVGSMRVI